MGHFIKALKAGLSGFSEGMKDADQSHEYVVAGKPVVCPHCGHSKFETGEALLNSPSRTFFNLDWTDPLATILLCAECGRIEWFAKAPEPADK